VLTYVTLLPLGLTTSVLRLQNDKDVENVRPPADIDRRPASADCRPYHRKFETDVEFDVPRVTVTERPTRPFTELVRLQRPALTRQNWERVRTKAAAAAATAGKSSSSDATASANQGLPVHG